MANTGMWTVVFFGCAILTWFDFWGSKSSSNSEKIIPTLKKPTNPLPTLQFMFCVSGYRRVFEEMSRIVLQKYPYFIIEGDTYPPPAWRAHLAKFLQLLKYSVILMTVFNFDPFGYLGYPTPNFVSYAMQNKVSFCLMTFLLGNIIEGQLLSTGAFEIYLDGEYQITFASQLHISDRTYWFFKKICLGS
uniref:Selenoprotein T n=1 Tax=Schistosoma curassoni TaxID=6186 RepID=A0A183KBK0_9TREM